MDAVQPVPSVYTPQGQMTVLTPGVLFPEMFGKDPYDMDPGWRPIGFVYALEGTKGARCANSAQRRVMRNI